MSKSLISDEAIRERAAEKYSLPSPYTAVRRFSYFDGQQKMRDLMLKEIVGPLMVELEHAAYIFDEQPTDEGNPYRWTLEKVKERIGE